MSDSEKKSTFGCLPPGAAFGAALVVAIAALSMKRSDDQLSPRNSDSGAPGVTSTDDSTTPTSASQVPTVERVESFSQPPLSTLTVADLTPFDLPLMITLKKQASFESGVNGTIKRVQVPEGSVVRLESLRQRSAIVNFNNAQIMVPVEDTDLLDRATRKRAQNEAEARRRAEQAARDRAERENAERQANELRKREAEAAKLAKEAEHKQKLALIGPKPTGSLWDGSYTETKSYLKASLRDPDSLKVYGSTKPFFTEDGWVVGCDYGAKNGFGGMVRESQWFVIRGGTVVAVKDSSAYNFR